MQIFADNCQQHFSMDQQIKISFSFRKVGKQIFFNRRNPRSRSLPHCDQLFLYAMVYFMLNTKCLRDVLLAARYTELSLTNRHFPLIWQSRWQSQMLNGKNWMEDMAIHMAVNVLRRLSDMTVGYEVKMYMSSVLKMGIVYRWHA